MIKINRWRPDTCECVVEYTFDDSIENSEHTLKNIIKCDIHKNKADNSAYTSVKEENKSKNYLLRDILDNFSEYADIEIDKKGKENRSLKSNFNYVWEFDENRKVSGGIEEI